MTDEPRYCSTCKHHAVKTDTAHQQRCKRFVEGGEPIPCAVARYDPEKCPNGSLWEAG
jgi:hypothetical protein